MSTSTVEYARVESLGLCVRITNCLRAESVWFVYELCDWSERDLRKLRGMGEQSIVDITRALAQRGLALRVEREEWR
jgi:DNA-directed RNA polymerase subunit alpha